MSVAASFTSQVELSVLLTQLDALGYLTQYKINNAPDSKLAYGVASPAANQVSTVPANAHVSRHTITVASLTLDIDLSTLTNLYGNCNFTKILAIYIKNRDASGGAGLKVGGNAPANWWQGFGSAAETVDALGEKFFSSPVKGKAVNAGSRVLRFVNDASSSGAVTFDLIVVGQ